jgi:hypothetical protein
MIFGRSVHRNYFNEHLKPCGSKYVGGLAVQAIVSTKYEWICGREIRFDTATYRAWHIGTPNFSKTFTRFKDLKAWLRAQAHLLSVSS